MTQSIKFVPINPNVQKVIQTNNITSPSNHKTGSEIDIKLKEQDNNNKSNTNTTTAQPGDTNTITSQQAIPNTNKEKKVVNTTWMNQIQQFIATLPWYIIISIIICIIILVYCIMYYFASNEVHDVSTNTKPNDLIDS